MSEVKSFSRFTLTHLIPSKKYQNNLFFYQNKLVKLKLPSKTLHIAIPTHRLVAKHFYIVYN
jgi:hypothetical protein